MAGMPRSGGTVLSAILNQNSTFCSPPISPLFKMYARIVNSHTEPENIDFNRDSHILDVYELLGQNFYKNNNSEYIVDRNLNWTSPIGVEMISKFINNNVKIICPVRNIVDILASYDTIINANDNSRSNPMDQAVIAKSFPDKPLADRRADFLMQSDNDIYVTLNYIKTIFNSEHRDIIHIVDYDELTSKPQETLDSVYDFLKTPRFNHNFNNIEDIFNIPSKSVIGIYDLYKVNSKLEKVSLKAEDVLLPETIKRYSGLEFWK